MSASHTVTQSARAVARGFIEAFNDRDLDALRALITEDAEFRKPSGELLHGPDGLEALVRSAEEMNVRLVALRDGTVEERDDLWRLTLPVRELIGPDDIERSAEFELRDGHVAAFALRPLR
jgi:limonene-1,2-epoxide hydrolase